LAFVEDGRSSGFVFLANRRGLEGFGGSDLAEDATT